MSFVRDLLESIGLRKRDARIGMRPHRAVELPLGIDAAHERVIAALDRVLGANIYADERPASGAHTIEAGFGTLNAERIRVSLEAADATQTRVRIEAHYPAGTAHPAKSLAVDTLADAIEAGVGH
jgi:hypothetical protein